MFAIGLVLLVVGGIGSLVCWIMILIKMFQNDKPLIGILGILCGMWAFIWGWMKSSSLGLKKTMMIWSVCFGMSIVGNILYGVGMAAKIQSGEIQMPQPVPAPAP
jgi:hypothetical protein